MCILKPLVGKELIETVCFPVYALSKYLLVTHYMTDTILGDENIMVAKVLN